MICSKCDTVIYKKTCNGRRLCFFHYKESEKERRIKYKETIKKTLKSWRLKNPEYMKKWMKNHPTFCAENRLKNIIHAREVGRKYIFDKYDHKCFICSRESNLVIDHIFPVSKGGMSTKDNLEVLCCFCNSRKGDIILDKLSIIRIKKYSLLCQQSLKE